MANHVTEAVIAGSKSFALALLAPLTERVGTRPRIAADPSQAVALTGGKGLVVVEFQGEGSLDAIRRLRHEADGLDVIAAVPDGNATAEETLRSLGVESARWDGRPDEVLAAVARRLGTPVPGSAARAADPAAAPAVAAARVAAPAAAPAPAPATATATGPAAASAVGALFDDLELGRDAAASAGAAAPAALPAPVAAADAGDWPAGLPSASDAADALMVGIAGVFPPAGSPLAIVAEVLAGMSPLERAVLVGEPQPFDPAPVREAAVMRLRVAVAIASAPPPDAPVDAGAVSALLGEIDAILGRVNALVADAPPEVQPALEQVRNAVVKEAVSFSEAAQREAAHAGTPEGAAHAVTSAAARRASRARVLSVASDAERRIEHEEEARRRKGYVVLAIVAVLAAGYHGYRLWTKQRALAAAQALRTTRAGAPADATIIEPPRGGPILIKASGGRAFTAEELRRIEGEEALRGNTVRQISPSSLVVVPGAARAGAGALAPAPGGGHETTSSP